MSHVIGPALALQAVGASGKFNTVPQITLFARPARRVVFVCEHRSEYLPCGAHRCFELHEGVAAILFARRFPRSREPSTSNGCVLRDGGGYRHAPSSAVAMPGGSSAATINLAAQPTTAGSVRRLAVLSCASVRLARVHLGGHGVVPGERHDASAVSF
jgi:hypothetical protein